MLYTHRKLWPANRQNTRHISLFYHATSNELNSLFPNVDSLEILHNLIYSYLLVAADASVSVKI